MRLSILTSAVLLFSILIAFAAKDEITIYLTKNRPAQEMVKIAGSLFAGKANITSSNEKILIAADAKTTAQVIHLLDELDQRQKSLRVLFRWKGASASQSSNKGISGEVGGKGWKGKVVSPKKSGASVSVGGVTANGESSDGASQSGATQSLLLTGAGEGKISLSEMAAGAFLKVKAIPLASNLVNLEVEQVGRDGNSVGAIQTHITIPYGQWTSLGGVKVSGSSSETQIAAAQKGEIASTKELEVRVEQASE